MTNKKAIRVLEHIEHYLKTHTNESCEEEHTAIDLAIKALKFANDVFPKTFIDYLNVGGKEE